MNGTPQNSPVSVVDSRHFHPLRGHVADGVVVRMSDNTRYTIRAVMAGWCLEDADGKQVKGPTRDAIDLDRWIYEMEGHARSEMIIRLSRAKAQPHAH
jgi:hypothetical protein